MGRKLSPTTAAAKIAQMIEDGEASDAADAANKNPALKPGLEMAGQSLVGAGKTRPPGSGPALMER